jgi:hypothetical protein
MPDADYRAWVEVLPSFDRFNENVQSAVVGGMAGAGTAGSASMGTALVAGVSKFAKPLLVAIAALGISTAIADQVTAGAEAALNYVQRSVDLASDLNESVNAVTVAYKDQAEAVLKLGQNSTTSYGLTALDLNNFAVRFSGFAGRIAGDGGDVAATLQSIIARGTDFASVYNIDVAEALRLFQSGLAGEMEPLRRYGIDLSMATVKSYAYAGGIAEQGKALTDTQRVQAAYLALLDQTSDTQGDFANTSDQFANSLRIMQAELDQTAAEFGTELLPVLTEILAFAKNELLPIWKDFNAEFGPELRDALEEAWPQIKELVLTVLPLIPPALETVIRWMSLLGETITEQAVFWNLLIATAKDLFALLSGDLSLDEFVANWSERWKEFHTVAVDYMRSVLGEFIGFGVKVLAAVAKIGANLYQAGRTMIANLVNGIMSSIGLAGSAMQNLMNYIAGFFPHSPAKHGPFAGIGWTAVRDAGTAITAQFESGFGRTEVPLSASISTTTVPMSAEERWSTGPLAGSSSRPVYADGIGLIGWIKEIAGREAELVFASLDRQVAQDARGGVVM